MSATMYIYNVNPQTGSCKSMDLLAEDHNFPRFLDSEPFQKNGIRGVSTKNNVQVIKKRHDTIQKRMFCMLFSISSVHLPHIFEYPPVNVT